MSERNAIVFDGPVLIFRAGAADFLVRVRVDLREVWSLSVFRITEPVVTGDEIRELIKWRATMVGPGDGEVEIDLESSYQANHLVEHWERVRGYKPPSPTT